MITKTEYENAQRIVDAWNDQEYQKQLEMAMNDFPIGTVIKDAYHENYPSGPIIRYYRLYNEVYFDIDAGGGAVGLISHKHAQKV